MSSPIFFFRASPAVLEPAVEEVDDLDDLLTVDEELDDLFYALCHTHGVH